MLVVVVYQKTLFDTHHVIFHDKEGAYVDDVDGKKECCFWVRERINYCMIDMVTEKVDSGVAYFETHDLPPSRHLFLLSPICGTSSFQENKD